MISPLDTVELRRLLAKADIPWALDEDEFNLILTADDDVLLLSKFERKVGELIVAAVNAMPALLDIVDAAEALDASMPGASGPSAGAVEQLRDALARLDSQETP